MTISTDIWKPIVVGPSLRSSWLRRWFRGLVGPRELAGVYIRGGILNGS